MASDPSTKRNHARRRARLLLEVAATLDLIKVTAGCVDCGFNRWPEALQFDHVDRNTKRKSLGWVADRSRLRTRAMVARYLDHIARYCVVRCANCHIHHSKVQGHWTPANREPGQAPEVFETLF